MDATFLTRPRTTTARLHDGAPATVDGERALAEAGRLSHELPVLRGGFRIHRLPEDHAALALRLQAALWEVAARHDVAVCPGASIQELARLLVSRGAIVPPAGDAVRLVDAVLDVKGQGEVSTTPRADDVARVVTRLVGYLELRARFG